MLPINKEKLICDIPSDLYMDMEVPMYVYGIRLKLTKNVLVTDPLLRTKVYSYFDENGHFQTDHIDTLLKKKQAFVNANLVKYDSGWYGYTNRSRSSSENIIAGGPSDTCYYGDGRDVFDPVDLPHNIVLTKMLFSRKTNLLQKGDSAEKLHEIVKKVYIHTPSKKECTEFERMFQHIDKASIRKDGKTFNSATITVRCASFVTKKDIMKYKKRIDALVVSRLKNDPQLTKLGISVNMLELSELTLTADHCLVYLFDIKKELRKLLV